MEKLYPAALLLNHMDLMTICSWAVSRASRIRIVDLFPSVQGTTAYLVLLLGLNSGAGTERDELSVYGNRSGCVLRAAQVPAG